jgi:hypothetical protein
VWQSFFGSKRGLPLGRGGTAEADASMRSSPKLPSPHTPAASAIANGAAASMRDAAHSIFGGCGCAGGGAATPYERERALLDR